MEDSTGPYFPVRTLSTLGAAVLAGAAGLWAVLRWDAHGLDTGTAVLAGAALLGAALGVAQRRQVAGSGDGTREGGETREGGTGSADAHGGGRPVTWTSLLCSTGVGAGVCVLLAALSLYAFGDPAPVATSGGLPDSATQVLTASALWGALCGAGYELINRRWNAGGWGYWLAWTAFGAVAMGILGVALHLITAPGEPLDVGFGLLGLLGLGAGGGLVIAYELRGLS